MNDKENDPAPAFNVKKATFFVVVALIFFLLAALSVQVLAFSDKVTIALIALSISLILFGLLDSTSKVTLTEINGVKLGKGISLTGAAGGFVVVFLMISDDEQVVPPPTPTMDAFDIVFHSPLYLESQNRLFDKEKLVITQVAPINFSLSDYPIVPLENVGSEWGKYKVIERKLDAIGDKMHLVAKRKVTTSFPGPVSAIPTFNICFHRSNDLVIGAEFECQSRTCTLTENASNITPCESESAKVNSDGWGLFSRAYAQSEERGWITPSLSTLEEMNETEHITYVDFHVSASDLRLPDRVNNFSYALSVNHSPIYLNGWQENETRTAVNPSMRFEFQFGLQNLDFSGKDFGQENIHLTFKFFSDDQLVKTHAISRKYIALRQVQETQVQAEDGTVYRWRGNQFFGKDDGYEVFIWSSEKPDELVGRRKLFFDDEDITYDTREVVSVIRPPLNENENWGLVVGLKDQFGRVEFTFNKEKADDILAWAKTDLLGKRTRKRPETGHDHPLIKAPYLYELKGH
ncbi:hypothetical protein [Alteromonas halophila]|uniref:Uncharacterized protein n=1 Tax=Alteromonas halophila TaxID=516698 RepID=A0A918JL92_9ALTE|nr:hypothetical protein [Alteromonas halophila]GGW83091.1 hypothetical protein GCM10007391_15450 [Alteromonas halophila]